MFEGNCSDDNRRKLAILKAKIQSCECNNQEEWQMVINQIKKAM